MKRDFCSRLTAALRRGLLLGILLLALPLSASGTSTDSKDLGYDDLLGNIPGRNDHPHNFSTQATHGGIKAANTGDLNETRICVYCHTPHGGMAQSTLWSRQGPDVSGWPLFDGPDPLANTIIIDDDTTNSQYGVGEYPNGATKFCLSCHDGQTAIGEMTSGIVVNMINGWNNMDAWAGSDSARLGKIFETPATTTNRLDFDRTHPVSFVFNGTVIAEIEAIKGAGAFQDWATIERTILDSQSRMQCTTCHDPHLDTFVSGSYKYPLWRDHGVTGLTDDDDFQYTCDRCHGDGTSGTGHNN